LAILPGSSPTTPATFQSVEQPQIIINTNLKPDKKCLTKKADYIPHHRIALLTSTALEYDGKEWHQTLLDTACCVSWAQQRHSRKGNIGKACQN